MSLSVKIDGVEYASTRVRLRANGEQGITGLSSAADGTGSQGGIVLDDPKGEVVLREWMEVIVEETDCIEASRLFTGYIADYTERRGKYRDGPGREIDITINDQNCLLSLRNLTGGDTNRDAETDTQRLNWLIHSDYLDGIVFDTGFINGADRLFDAEDLHGQFPAEVIGNLCGPRGQSFFAFFDQDARKVSLFYDAPTATTLTSALSVSNVLADVGPIDGPDTTCFFPYIDAERNSSGEDLADNIRYKYKGGVAYRTNPTTQATYFPEPLRHRGINVQNDLVGLRTTAITFADRILAARSTPIVVVTFTLRLPARKVGWIDAGYRLPVKFSHLTGFSDFTYTRVETKALTQTDGRRDYYDVSLTCSLNGYRGSTTGGGGVPGTDPFPVQPGECETGDYFTNDLAFGKTVTLNPGNKTSADSGTATGTYAALPTTGATDHDDGTGGPFGACCANYLGGPRWDQYDIDLGTAMSIGEAQIWDPDPVNPPNNTGSGGLEGAEIWASDDGATYHQVTDVADWVYRGSIFEPIPGDLHECWGVPIPADEKTHRYWGFRWKQNFVSGFWNGYAFRGLRLIECTGGDEPPASGGPNGTGEIVVMDGNQGTTAHPYAPLSLHVFVDNTDQTAAVTETDPTCGLFTLAFTPTPTEVVKVYYVVG